MGIYFIVGFIFGFILCAGITLVAQELNNAIEGNDYEDD